MKKNDLLTGIVDSIGYNGEGILRVDGTTVFVPFVLADEEIEFKVLKVKDGVAYGKCEKIIKSSPSRVEPLCAVYKKCGGCQLQHCAYEKQSAIKKNTVENCFKKIAGLNVSIEKSFPSPDSYGYRNKLQLPVRSENGEVKIGFFRENSHDVIETDDCPLQPDWAKKVITAVKNLFSIKGFTAYDESTKKGLLRHVIAREINGEFLFTFVYNGDTKKFDNGLIEALSSKFDAFSLFVNVNTAKNNVILGKEWRKVSGKGYIDVSEFGIDYSLGAQSFFQVNTPVKEEIYKDVFDLADIDKDTVVIDAFSGAGVLTAMLAKRAKKAYGVEIIKEATDSADALAKRNGIKNMTNVCADCGEGLPALVEKAKTEGKRTVLVFDPPRSGVDRDSIAAAIKVMPDTIIYVSCSPQTLARDAGLLVGSLKYENDRLTNVSADFSPNYVITSVGIYDMFPQTKHVETLCLLRKQ